MKQTRLMATAMGLLMTNPVFAQTVPQAPTPAPVVLPTPAAAAQGARWGGDPVPTKLPHSYNPFRTYLPDSVAPIKLANSPGVEGLIRDGKMYLSLQDAIELALENNLDLAIARYNLPIAEADIERTKGGGYDRGVNAGVVNNTPSSGVGLASGGGGGGAGGTTSAGGGAGAGASGLVQNTLGTGTAVSSYDPQITGNAYVEHYDQPLSNLSIYGVPSLNENLIVGNVQYNQAFPTGTSLQVEFQNSRVTENSPFTFLNPTLNSYYQVLLEQPLLAGFGFGPNLRYLHIAKNNKRITDYAFKEQVISTISQIADIYWDLVAAYQDEQLKEQSLEFAQDTLTSDQQQLKLQAIPALDVTKAAGAVAAADGDLSISKVTLESEESLMKNALTRNLDNPVLEAVPVIPTDSVQVDASAQQASVDQLVAEAMQDRPDLHESEINLENERISNKAVNNELLPSVNLVGYYGGTGLSGIDNPAAGFTSTAPTGFGGAVQNAFNNSAPNYYVGVNVSIPLRNRVAKSDQYRSQLEYRQSQLYEQQEKNQIRIQVRNAQYALEQSAAHVVAAAKARDLAQQGFDIAKQEQKLGAGSQLDTLTAQHALALASSTVAAADTTYEKTRVALDQATGQTLESYHVSLSEAKTGMPATAAP